MTYFEKGIPQVPETQLATHVLSLPDTPYPETIPGADDLNAYAVPVVSLLERLAQNEIDRTRTDTLIAQYRTLRSAGRDDGPAKEEEFEHAVAAHILDIARHSGLLVATTISGNTYRSGEQRTPMTPYTGNPHGIVQGVRRAVLNRRRQKPAIPTPDFHILFRERFDDIPGNRISNPLRDSEWSYGGYVHELHLTDPANPAKR